jgi:hypothetical protein
MITDIYNSTKIVIDYTKVTVDFFNGDSLVYENDINTITYTYKNGQKITSNSNEISSECKNHIIGLRLAVLKSVKDLISKVTDKNSISFLDIEKANVWNSISPERSIINIFIEKESDTIIKEKLKCIKLEL